MNSSVKFFEPIVTVFPWLAGLSSMTLAFAFAVDPPAPELDDADLSFDELPHAASARDATNIASVPTRFMPSPSFCLRAARLWVSLPSAADRNRHRLPQRLLLPQSRPQACQPGRKPAR